jgi:hypothetical protein
MALARGKPAKAWPASGGTEPEAVIARRLLSLVGQCHGAAVDPAGIRRKSHPARVGAPQRLIPSASRVRFGWADQGPELDLATLDESRHPHIPNFGIPRAADGIKGRGQIRGAFFGTGALTIVAAARPGLAGDD